MSAISSALAGLHSAQLSLDNTAQALANFGSSSTPDAAGDSVDLSSTMISLINARNQAAASVKVFHAVDDMQKSLFSLLG